MYVASIAGAALPSPDKTLPNSANRPTFGEIWGVCSIWVGSKSPRHFNLNRGCLLPESKVPGTSPLSRRGNPDNCLPLPAASPIAVQQKSRGRARDFIGRPTGFRRFSIAGVGFDRCLLREPTLCTFDAGKFAQVGGDQQRAGLLPVVEGAFGDFCPQPVEGGLRLRIQPGGDRPATIGSDAQHIGVVERVVESPRLGGVEADVFVWTQRVDGFDKQALEFSQRGSGCYRRALPLQAAGR